ncbi:MAG: pentapeptide repeat-containing protein [Candidatus Poseidoniia archaeon]|nr:pentapeptide repeat-containing protein [Candidatus Poseidoniia archaeon]
MNKAVIVALLFCVTSFTGCIGGDNSTDLEVLKEEEQIEPVGQNDLSNVSKDLETLQSKVDEFLNDFNSLKSSQEVMNSSLSNMIGDLETDLLILELDLKSISNDLDHLHDDMDEMGEIKKDQFLLQLEVSNMSNDLAELVNGLNQLTLMSLMDENERHVFMKMLMVQRIKEEGASNLNLTGADLSGQDLSGVDFSDADLSHANLDGARFVGNNFSGAKLDHSHANGAYFRLVNFEATSVSNSHWNAVEIVDSSIENSKFDNTEMHNCIIHHTSLIGSNFDRVKANDCYFYFVEGQESSWKGASLDHSTFEVSNFDESDFSKIVDGPSTKMVGVTYASVSFIEATFAFADMSHSTMEVSSNLPSGFLSVMKAGGNDFRNCIDNNDDGDNYDCYSQEDNYDQSRDQEWVEEYNMYSFDNYRYVNCVDFMSADLNNTKLDNSKICVTQLPEGYNLYPGDMYNQQGNEQFHTSEFYPTNARFVDTQFRRADMTNVHFGGSTLGWDTESGPGDSTYNLGWQFNATSGCYRLELSCMNLRGAALTLADLSNSHFDYADLSGADFSGSSAAGVAWGHAMWHETNWTDSSEISGRGDPNNWESD